MPCPFGHLRVIGVIGKVGLVRMDPDAGPDLGILRLATVFFCETNAAVSGVWPITVADREIGNNSRRLRPSQHIFAVGVEAVPSR